ncbi:MAG: isochorismate synthase [Deltaproteobacteria bacterium]|nr:isochorismate synthase [Deltaproteobacteria bacterium]
MMINAEVNSADDQIAVAIEHARGLGKPVLLTVSGVVAPPEDLLDWLRPVEGTEERCFFWERPADGFAIAALGATAVVRGHGPRRFTEVAAVCDGLIADAVTDRHSQAIGAPFFVGGFAFATDVEDTGPWCGFPPGLMVLPRLLIVRHRQRATFTVTCMVTADSERPDIVRRLHADMERLQSCAAAAQPKLADDPVAIRCQSASTPPVARWKQAVLDTLEDIAHGRLEKLVLARSCTVAAAHRLDCGRILRNLRKAYPSCVLFWIGTPQGDFLGATPEPLVRLSGRCVSTAAIAGSTAPGTSAADASALALALRRSDKDRLEHAIVVRAIADALRPVCGSLDVAPEPQLLRLDNVQHLMTPITGTLRSPHHVLDLVDRLHPSPAVAGHPRAAALRLLPQREALSRGWYAGPIGWMDARHDGEFAVAIRSALVRDAEASLFAGAGIVAGSDPDAELGETRLKLQPLLSALTES